MSDALELGGDLVDIAWQDRRELGIHHRRITPRHQPQERAHRVADRYLGEPRLARQHRQPALHVGEFSGMDKRDRASLDPVRPRGTQGVARHRLVQRLELPPIRGHLASHLRYPLVSHRRQRHLKIEQPGARLIADPQHIAKRC